MAAHGRCFAQLLDHWELSRPSVVAHDVGGAVALRTLLLEAELSGPDPLRRGQRRRVGTRTLQTLPGTRGCLPEASGLCARSTGRRPPTARHAHRVPARSSRCVPRTVAGASGQAAFYRQYSQIRQKDTLAYEHLLGDLSLPVRFLWGREDRILPPQYAEWLHARVPHAELHWIDGAGHLLQEDAPGQLLACLTTGFSSA
ncbi:alpha/beta fold hydrolase [Streptomyces sp. NPDC006530]|uniref:alpha/beta fold hydrolase n=1 Tax=Streptomyces sp. NPDC006530 TaxID=3364750 RepID=UPI0036922C9B